MKEILIIYHNRSTIEVIKLPTEVIVQARGGMIQHPVDKYYYCDVFEYETNTWGRKPTSSSVWRIVIYTEDEDELLEFNRWIHNRRYKVLCDEIIEVDIEGKSRKVGKIEDPNTEKIKIIKDWAKFKSVMDTINANKQAFEEETKQSTPKETVEEEEVIDLEWEQPKKPKDAPTFDNAPPDEWINQGVEQDEELETNVEKYDSTIILRRMESEMSARNIANIETVPLTLENLKKYAMGGNATDQEAMEFAQICAYQGLNPFNKDIYWIKAGGRSYTHISKDAQMKKANANPNFHGMKAGIIIKNLDGKVEEREGEMKLKAEVLLGGWCEVFRKDRMPVKAAVSLDDYRPSYPGWERGTWGKIPATMIRKVAIQHALREAFPESFHGLYIKEEFDQAGGSDH